MPASDGRSEWTDERIDDHMQALRELPTSVAKIAVQLEEFEKDTIAATVAIEKIGADCSDRDRRLHERIDQLADRLADRDREYRRNMFYALGPIAAVALLIGAKVLFNIDIPHP